MNEPATTKRRRPWGTYFVRAVVLGLFLFLAFTWYVQTDSFQVLVRRRFVAEIERVTGGRAEIHSFHTVPLRMRIELRGLVVHGLEVEGEAPLVQVDQISARIKIISLLKSDFGFHELIIDHPVVHLKRSPDGTTNMPAPRSARVSDGNPVDQLFSISVNEIQINRGELLLEDQVVPIEMAARDVSLKMDYSFLRNRYDGDLTIGNVDAAPLTWRRFACSGHLAFSLGKSFLEVKSLALVIGKSHVNADGRINDFRNPVFAGRYEALFDLSNVGAITRRYSLTGGWAEFKGQGAWSTARQEIAGRMTVRDLTWHDDDVNLDRAYASADVSLTPELLRVSRIEGAVWSGKFSGQAAVQDWLFPGMFSASANDAKITRNGKPVSATQDVIGVARPLKHRPVEPKGIVDLKLDNLAHEEIAKSFSTPKHPFGRFHPVGSISGAIGVRWDKYARDSDIEFSLSAVPPAKLGSGEVPVTAKAFGKYHSLAGTLELSQFKLNTPSTTLDASGSLTPNSSVHLSASSTDLQELEPVIAALGGPAKVPVTLGQASFQGTLSGSLSAPTLSGNVTADNFDVALPEINKMPAHRQHVDSFAAGVTLSSNQLVLRNATADSDGMTADLDGSVALHNWSFTPSSSFHARLELENAELEVMQRYAGYADPISGKASISVDASGTQDAPQAAGSVHVTDAVVYGEKIRTADSKFSYQDGWVSLADLALFRGDAELTGSAAYNPKTRGLRLDLNGQNIDLATVPELQTKELRVDGIADFTVKADGDLDSPNISGHLRGRDLLFDRERSGEFDSDFSSQGNQLLITGHSQFVHGSVTATGTIGMVKGTPMDINFSMDHLDVDPLWVSYLKGTLTGHSAVGGTFEMRGNLVRPTEWTLIGKLSHIYVDVEYAKIHNDGLVTFRSERQAVKIEPLHMVGDGTDLTGHGSMDFAGAGKFDLYALGKIDLKLAGSFVHDLTSSGTMTVDLHVGGTMDEPYPQGKVQISNATANYATLPSGISDLNGSLTFSQTHFFIDSLNGKTGGGTLEFKGDATYFQHSLHFNLTAIGKDVRLRYPPGVSSTADATLHWIGTPSSSTVTGDVFVNKLAVTPGFDFSSYLGHGGSLISLVPADSPMYRVKLDVHLTTAPELQMKTAVARLSGDADLHLRGSLANPALVGRVEILEGDALFNGTRFHLERGDILFANPVSIEPQVNLEATTRVRNYDIDLIVTGKPAQTGGLTVNYRADPPLPQSDIISLLALGRTNQESEQLQQQSVESQLGGDASALLLTQALNSAVTSRLQRLFGVSRIKVDPQGAVTDTNALARGPQVTIEQQFANNLTLSYSTNLSQQSNQQIIRGEYYVTKDVSLVGLRDRNGVVSFDIRIRRRKK